VAGAVFDWGEVNGVGAAPESSEMTGDFEKIRRLLLPLFAAFPFTQAPRQTGMDYGNRRNCGINSTQLLFLLYLYQNQQLLKATVCTNAHLGNRSCSTQ
jgi:hypothetical protein